MANIAKIKKMCISNGEGLRTAVFFSGCPHHCENCFNQELWDSNYGIPYSEKIEKVIFNTINEHIDGLSILGGEPLSDYNYQTVLQLCKHFKINFPNNTIWLWTGYTIEELKKYDKIEILSYIDTLIDGKFIQDLYDYNLKWRGSSNQRILKKGKDF